MDLTVLAASADTDGISNLMESTLGLNPRSSGVTRLPAIFPGVSPYSFNFRFLRARSDLTNIVQTSEDLIELTPIATNPGSIGTSVTVPYSPAPVPAKVFHCLKVTKYLTPAS